MPETNLQFPIICGPTASGKSAAVYRLADEFDLELISVDSRQIFRHLNIGTGKPNQIEQKKLQHHLIDIIDPGERYSSFQFLQDADRSIADILNRNRVPVIAGGTGFYIRALTDGVVRIEQDDSSIRLRLEKELEQYGAEYLHERLTQIDPEDAKAIHPNNSVRLVRALEIYELTGKTRTELLSEGEYVNSPYHFRIFSLLPDRASLYATINARVDQMLEDGWLDEVKSLVEAGWEQRIRQSNVIGYTELIDHLQGTLNLDVAIETIKQNTRRYAKRQYTWFRNQTGGEQFNSVDELVVAVRECVKNAQ